MLSVRCLLSILTRHFAILYVEVFKFLITHRTGKLGLCNFNCAFSFGCDGFFWVRYFILCLSVIKLYFYNFYMSFRHLFVGTFGSKRKLLAAINVCNLLEYEPDFIITNVLPVSA